MKRRSFAPLRLDYSAALRRMFKGSKLVRTNGKRVEFAISPGGAISNATAERLLQHSLCRIDELPDKPQSWAFDITVISDN